METELRSNLLACASAYAAAKDIKMSYLGRLVGQDTRFFDRISDPEKGFTVRVYSRCIRWFSDEWPTDLEWPQGVQRPARAETAA